MKRKLKSHASFPSSQLMVSGGKDSRRVLEVCLERKTLNPSVLYPGQAASQRDADLWAFINLLRFEGLFVTLA